MGLSDRQTDACVAQVELPCGGKWTQISDLGWMRFFDFRDRNRGSLPLFDGMVLFSTPVKLRKLVILRCKLTGMDTAIHPIVGFQA